MAEKAGEVINDILLELIVLGSNADMDPSETAVTIRYINRFMSKIALQGVNLGFTKITSVSDTITIADGAITGLIKNVAKSLAPQFGAVLTLDFLDDARDGLDAMRRAGSAIVASSMPCTLPRGSGNDWGGVSDARFYPCPDDQILTETNRNILLEDETNGD